MTSLWLDLAFWLGVALIFGYEIIAFEQKKGETISEITWRIITTHPLVGVATGVLIGHLFWQSAFVYAGRCK
jgi:hypothetical protein